jgi:hypothetical protein
MPKRSARSKPLRHGQIACLHDRPAFRQAAFSPAPESDSGLFSSQSLTRANSCGRAPLCLWMDSGCGCADSANHIT